MPKLILICLFAIGGLFLFSLIIGGIIYLVDTKEDNSTYKPKSKSQELYDLIWSSSWNNDGEPIDIRNFLQLTFDEWLVLYKAAPKDWDLIKEQFDKTKCIFPKFIGGDDDVFTFWKDAEELDKFQSWYEDNYERGKTIEFQLNREEALEKITNCITS